MPLTPLTFRIFVSSTFTDLKGERNALHRTVFPALRKLCEDHGARFQAIDLRWGVRDEAALDQQTMRICLDEIRRCQDVTPKPNFIVLLGERYGWRPLPPEIPASEWNRIAQSVGAGDAGTERLRALEAWYKRDENARTDGDPPGAWVLDSRARHERGTDRYEDGQTWETDVERPLRAILEGAAVAQRFDDLDRLKYGGSATAQEIARGALGVSDAQDHIFCFFRTINGLPSDGTAEGYRDLAQQAVSGSATARLVADTAADAMLRQVKGQLAAALPAEHIFPCEAAWLALPETLADEEWAQLNAQLGEELTAARERGDVRATDRVERLRALAAEWYERAADSSFLLSPRIRTLDAESRADLERQLRRAVFHDRRPPISIAHIDPLCRDVTRVLSDVILREIRATEAARQQSNTTEVDEEVAAHDRFARERLRSRKDPGRSIFVGRATALARIRKYLGDSDQRPLALSGEPGSGKSALMAQAVEQAKQSYPGAVVVSRFIGWTPGSGVVRELLDKLCRQIARAYGVDEATPSDYRELVQELPKRLALATAQKPLIVILDGLDQLADADHARNLIWLPVELPPHVRLVVSTSTEPGDTDAVLKRRLPDASRFPLDDMPVDEADQLLRHWFDDVGRTLEGRGRTYAESVGQWRHVLDAYSGCRRPLYLRLAFEEARRWRSFDALSRTPLAPDILGLVQQLFDRLSTRTNHGDTLVAASLGALMAARHGLTEDEMIQLLSRDPALLAEVKKYHRPPEEKLPVVIWSRLYFDLQPYLTERRADETSLFAFFHRQLDQVARARYLDPVKAGRHRALAEYFGEQELFLGEAKAPNVRKLSELPYQQTFAGDMWDKLYETLTDFDFLEAKCTHVAVTTEGTGSTARKVYGGVYELQEDYRVALEHMPAE